MLRAEWGADLIASWNKHNWIALPQCVGAKLARLLGAGADEVISCDSTTVNLFKVVSAALALHKDRAVIISGAPAGLLAVRQPKTRFSTCSFLSYPHMWLFNSARAHGGH